LPPFESRQGLPPRGSLPFQGINISIFLGVCRSQSNP
jgi:hypothetical protein